MLFRFQIKDDIKTTYYGPFKNVQMQGAQVLRNEAYFSYAAMTKDAAQRRRWAFFNSPISL
jgi:hypothetical protein